MAGGRTHASNSYLLEGSSEAGLSMWSKQRRERRARSETVSKNAKSWNAKSPTGSSSKQPHAHQMPLLTLVLALRLATVACLQVDSKVWVFDGTPADDDSTCCGALNS